MLVGFIIHREMSFKTFYWETLENSLGDIGSVMFILSMSTIFGYGMIWERIPEKLAEFLLGISSNPNVLMIMISLFLVFAGLFVDATALILMLTAILLPVARQVGIDPVHFGLVFILSAAMGNQTPPVGASMYAGCSVLGATIEEYIQASWPFLFVTILAIFLVIFFPQIVLFIPNLIFG